MVLRLVLVGIVAGLGVSPPAECELSGWTRSVQTRLLVWLARADAVTPLGENVDDGDGRGAEESAVTPDLEEPQAERIGATLPARVAEDPVAVADVDDEEDALAAAEPDATGEADLDLAAEESVAPAPAPVGEMKVADAPAFDAIVEEMVADFALESDAKAGSDADDMGLELADATDREAGSDDAAPATPDPVATVADVAQPEGVEDLYPGEAFALNRMADGLDAPGPADVADAPPAGHQLSKAVRLTRDAVYAWMNLIQSPAIVTISR